MSSNREAVKERFDLYLSYSGRRKYVNCGLSYRMQYIQRIPVERDPKDSLFGSVIGAVFEQFYRKALWSRPDVVQACLDEAEPCMADVFRKEKFDPSSAPDFVSNLRTELSLFIPAGIEIIRANKLVAPSSCAEMDLSVVYASPDHGPRIMVGGRTDIALIFDMSTVWILDGKASKHREKYADVEQLLWYATQFYLKYHVVPSRLGFIYWRFPTDAVQWVEFDEEKIRKSLASTVQAAKDILAKKFEPTPNPSCTLCPYRGKCPEGTRYVAAKKVADGGRIEESIFDIEPL